MDAFELDWAHQQREEREEAYEAEIASLRAEVERLRAEREALRAQVEAAHDVLSRIDGLDEESCHTLESTVEYVARRYKFVAESEALAAAQVEAARQAVHIADDEDVTDWQRGYRACADRALSVLSARLTEGATP